MSFGDGDSVWSAAGTNVRCNAKGCLSDEFGELRRRINFGKRPGAGGSGSSLPTCSGINNLMLSWKGD